MPLSIRKPVRSLANVRAGENVRIEGFVFGQMRERCHSMGLDPGQVVQCRASTIGTLVLRSRAGRTFILEQDWAPWIRVSTVARPRAGV